MAELTETDPNASVLSGRCLCGQITWSSPAPPIWTALCHCDSCRRACSAPVVAWMGFPEHSIIWTGTRKFRRSSEIARRGFCPDCGTQMSFESTRWRGEIHLYAASLDNPNDYVPELHCHYDEKLPWLHMEDSLPKYLVSADEGSPFAF